MPAVIPPRDELAQFGAHQHLLGGDIYSVLETTDKVLLVEGLGLDRQQVKMLGASRRN